MKAAIYARESSDDTNKAPPISKQIEIGKAWLEAQGHEVVLIFADDGYSGSDWKRPDWNRSVREAKRHGYNLLWVWNQDRIARDTEQFLFYYRNLKECFVRIFDNSINDYINMDDLGGRVKHTTLAQAAEIFRIVTSDKVKASYRAKKALQKGLPIKWGRPKKKIDLTQAMALRSQGMGFRTIAKELGCNYQKVRRALQNRVILKHQENKDISPLENDTGFL